MSQQHGKASTAVPSTSGKLSSTTAGGEAGIVETTEQQKIPKPSATEVTNKVLAVLMVSEPLTLADLCKQLPDLPRDSIQAVLEVLQVLALVVQLSTTKEAAASKSLSVNNQTFVFSLTEFAKFHTAFPITAIESEVKIMQSRNRDVRSRIEELQVRFGTLHSMCCFTFNHRFIFVGFNYLG